MAKLTQGTQIYFIDPAADSNGAAVVEVKSVTTLNPGGNPAGQIEVTSLAEFVRSYMPGLRTPGQASMSINADPGEASHIRLHELSEENPQPILKFALGWSDGTAAPTLDSADEFVLPTSRTWFTFSGYIADFPFDFSRDTVVTSQVSIQRSGGAVWIKKAA